MTPEETTAFVAAIVENAKRLGLTWTIRPATVSTTDGVNAVGTYDGDNGVLIPLINMVSAGAGERVYVIAVPEGGNYIVGRPGRRDLLDRVDSAVSSAAIGAEAVVLTGNPVLWINNRAYRVKIRSATTSSITNVVQYRIRQTNLTGTVLHLTQDLGNTTGFTMYDEMVIVRTGGTDLLDNLVLTVSASTGTVTMTGGATFVRYLEVWELPGAPGDYPNAITI